MNILWVEAASLNVEQVDKTVNLFSRSVCVCMYSEFDVGRVGFPNLFCLQSQLVLARKCLNTDSAGCKLLLASHKFYLISVL